MARIQEFTPMHNKAANRHQALTISTISSKNYSRSKRNALDKTNFVLEMSHNQKIAVQPSTAIKLEEKQSQ